MEKVNWTWDWSVYVPLCPYCNELAYEKDRCVFCGEAYEWVEGKYKDTIVEVGDYTIVQATNNHISIYENGNLVYHAAYNKKLTEDELRKEVDFLKLLRENPPKSVDSKTIQIKKFKFRDRGGQE